MTKPFSTKELVQKVREMPPPSRWHMSCCRPKGECRRAQPATGEGAGPFVSAHPERAARRLAQ